MKTIIYILLLLSTASQPLLAQWNTNGTNLYNTNSGNVGIGTISPDSKLVVNGDLKVINGKSYFGGYTGTAANANLYSIEIGGPNPTPTSGQATLFFHHHGVLAHQFRYNNGSFFLEAAGNGYGSNPYPSLFVGGSIGIGTTSADQKLTVNGKIKCEEVIVAVDVADYVFEENYPLKKLEEVDQYIKENKHLPGVPGKQEVDTKGYEVGLMTNKLLEKVEELTLYMIEQNKEIKALKEENKKITADLVRLEVRNK